MRVGRYEVTPLSDGRFRLDGGAMFGVVPRVLWEKRSPPDPRNRVTLGLNSLLVRGEGRTIVVETGIGDKWDDKGIDMFGIDRRRGLVAALADHGVAPDDVDVVILTHLHFDHAGGATRREGGALVPTFRRARHVVQAGELAEALVPSGKTRASYRPENVEPLVAAGLVEAVRGEAEPVPGIRVVPASGHIRDMQMVYIEGDGSPLVCWGDLIPTSAHIDPPWIMGYDLFPLETYFNKERLVPQAVDEGWISFFLHEPEARLGRIVRDGKRYGFEPLREV